MTTYLSNREIDELCIKIVQRLPDDLQSMASYYVRAALREEFGPTVGKVDPQNVLEIEPGRMTYLIQRVASAKAEPMDLINAEGLWPLQRAVADAKFDMLKYLIKEGYRVFPELRVHVRVIIDADALTLEADVPSNYIPQGRAVMVDRYASTPLRSLY